MGYLIGTDEAGYGPNLGPLVISATVWHAPRINSLPDLARLDLYEQFGDQVTADAPAATGHAVWIGDSKRLYKPGSGLRQLERGVLASLVAMRNDAKGEPLARWSDLWQRLDPQVNEDMSRSPWYERFDEKLPVDATELDIAQDATALRAACQQADIHLWAMRSAVVFPQRFNNLLEEHESKGQLLSRTTLDLVTQLIHGLPLTEPIVVSCDKHGGRNRYGRLIQAQFPDTLVEVHGESRALSLYRIGQAERRIEMRFQAKGESFLPSALASMVSKYLRELAMRAFNDFWCRRVPDLKPTAGYPVDARRFHTQIRPTQQRLQIGDADLWRRK